jgi:dTDP-4-amino-4,6-dideoxygalactose transaminase
LYDTELAKIGWAISNRSKETVLLRYPVRVAEKIKTLSAAQKEKIEIGSWFETPLHPIPLEKHSSFGYQLGQCPNAEFAAEHVINLPLHNRITPTEVSRIIEFLDKFVEPI